jgi:hypothetical protein
MDSLSSSSENNTEKFKITKSILYFDDKIEVKLKLKLLSKYYNFLLKISF